MISKYSNYSNGDIILIQHQKGQSKWCIGKVARSLKGAIAFDVIITAFCGASKGSHCSSEPSDRITKLYRPKPGEKVEVRFA